MEIVPLKLSLIPDVARIYAEVINPTYITEGELHYGVADDIGKFSDKAPQMFEEDLHHLLDDPGSVLFVALDEGRAVGFIYADMDQADAEPSYSECWLHDMGVTPLFQGRGIGKQLLDRACQWGKENGARYFLLKSGFKNHTAHALFEAEGFIPLATTFIKKA